MAVRYRWVLVLCGVAAVAVGLWARPRAQLAAGSVAVKVDDRNVNFVVLGPRGDADQDSISRALVDFGERVLSGRLDLASTINIENRTPDVVEIVHTQASCGCVAIPPTMLRLAPGESVPLRVTMHPARVGTKYEKVWIGLADERILEVGLTAKLLPGKTVTLLEAPLFDSASRCWRFSLLATWESVPPTPIAAGPEVVRTSVWKRLGTAQNRTELSLGLWSARVEIPAATDPAGSVMRIRTGAEETVVLLPSRRSKAGEP